MPDEPRDCYTPADVAARLVEVLRAAGRIDGDFVVREVAWFGPGFTENSVPQGLMARTGINVEHVGARYLGAAE